MHLVRSMNDIGLSFMLNIKDNKKCSFGSILLFMERATGIEPALEAWEASVLPLNYARNEITFNYTPFARM